MRAHFASDKHRARKTAVTVLTQEEIDLHQLVRDYKSIPCSNLPADIQVQRLQFLKAIFTSGVPLRRSEPLRLLFEKHALKLTSPSHMADYIPALQHHLHSVLRRELRDQFVNVTFDSTSSKADVYAFVLRFMDKDLTMQTRLGKIGLYKECLVSAELGRVLMEFLYSDTGKSKNLRGNS